jgi:hypothetical protein
MSRILRTGEIADQIRETLTGRRTKEELGRWASLAFLDEDQQRLEFDPVHNREIGRTIYDLMLMEEGAQYYLDDEELTAIMERLQSIGRG